MSDMPQALFPGVENLPVAAPSYALELYLCENAPVSQGTKAPRQGRIEVGVTNAGVLSCAHAPCICWEVGAVPQLHFRKKRLLYFSEPPLQARPGKASVFR